MALGMGLELQKSFSKFEISEGVIKDRYDDSDHMIDFSEEESKNKLLTTGKSLKFIVEDITKNKKVASIQGTIQTGSTAKETIHYLKKNGVKKIDIIVCYVPTIDGRQVGLYTSNRDFIANKYIGKVTSINQLNDYIANELRCQKLFYNSPFLLAKGIGISENNLWFPEWIRFLDYE
jgi:amidophosphoribosyltransferase